MEWKLGILLMYVSTGCMTCSCLPLICRQCSRFERTFGFAFVIVVLWLIGGVAKAGGGAESDRYAWLGPLPQKQLNKAAERKANGVIEAVRRDGVFREKVASFVCKTPSEVGPVPMMEFVERYLNGRIDRDLDDEAVEGLEQAAARGNWVARSELLMLLRDSTESGDHYRAAQLLDWLHARRIGSVYSLIGDQLKTARPYNNPSRHGVYLLDLVAALHHDYMSQHKVGKALLGSDNRQLAAVGRKMLDCASASMKPYRRLFSGEAAAMRERKEQEADSATYTSLHHAVWSGNVRLVRQALDAGKVDVNARSGGGQSALDLALLASPQNPEIVHILIASGATVVVQAAPDGCRQPCTSKPPLRVALDGKPVNPKVVEILMAAGADPFHPTTDLQNLNQTPFGRSFKLYDSGENLLVLELFLATGKLDPKSALANRYLVQSTGHLKVMERLLQYGITPLPSDELLRTMTLVGTVPEDEARRIAVIDKLQQQHPFLRTQMQGAEGFTALEQAVQACRLELATYLLDHVGSPKDESNGRGLLEGFLSNCDPPEEIPEHAGKPARQAFLSKLKQLRYDVNDVRAGDCPAWLYRDGPCGFPQNDDVVKALLDMGAQPFRLTPHHNSNGLLAAVESCREGALDLMLAKSPSKLDRDGRIVIEQTLELIADQPSRMEKNCSRNFYSKTAARLQALLLHR